MGHTTNELQGFIDSEAQAIEHMERAKRPAARAYLLGLQDAFTFLTSGKTTLGLADRDVDSDTLFQVREDPNKPRKLPNGVGGVNLEAANPTIEATPDVEGNQGNDHRGEKAVDHVKRAVQEHYTQGSGNVAERPLGTPASDEGIRRKR